MQMPLLYANINCTFIYRRSQVYFCLTFCTIITHSFRINIVTWYPFFIIVAFNNFYPGKTNEDDFLRKA